jgi:hypothetical protein
MTPHAFNRAHEKRKVFFACLFGCETGFQQFNTPYYYYYVRS